MPSVTGGSRDLVVSRRKELPETLMGKCGPVAWFIDDVKLRTFPSWLPNVPSLSISPWIKSNLVFSSARMKTTAQRLCSVSMYGPVHHLATLARVCF